MALIDKASLLMVPSTYEDGTLYNVLPSGNRAPDNKGGAGYDQTRADFTFDRGSNLAATRIDENGLIQKGRENLFTQSNNFSDSDWNVKAGTFTQGVEDPDGGNNAWSWTATNTDPYLYQSGKSLSGVGALSIWVKGVGSTIGKNFELRVASAPYKNVVLTGEWQRVEHFNNTASGTSVGFEYGNPAVGGDVVHIYQAQYEVGTIATAYMDSGSTTAKAGVLEDMPRISYDANGENGALKLEPLRTNSYLHSEYLYNFSGTETFNHATSPEGLKNATLLTKTSASDQFINMAWTGTTIAASSDYTMSIFVKHNGDDVNVRYEYNNSNDWGGVAWTALFEVRASGVTKSTAGNCTSNVEDFGNGWFRLKVFVTSGASITASSPANLFRVIGASAETLLVYGAQMEKGTYESSYIPTHGAAVSRSADSCSVTGVSYVIGQTEGTAYIEFTIDNLSESGNEKVLFYMKDTGTGERYLSFVNNGSLTYIESNGAVIANISKTGLSVGSYKAAIAYKTDDFAFYLNGEQVGTDNAGTPSGFSTFGLQYYNAAVSGTQYNKQAVLFDTRLTNAELATLTTL